MSSCDSVSPTSFRAGAEHPEGVTYTPREAPANPSQHWAPARELVWLRSQLNSNFLNTLNWCFISLIATQLLSFPLQSSFRIQSFPEDEVSDSRCSKLVAKHAEGVVPHGQLRV